jgi:beta-glucosidase
MGAHEQNGVAERPWLDSQKPVAERIELLLPQMSLAEKIAQLNRPNGVTNESLVSGVGLLMHTTFMAANVSETVRKRNALQRQFLSTGVGKRLGIPASWRSFINHGVCAFGVTFPENVGQGSTWDVELVQQVAAANAGAARAIGLDMEWYVMNLWADPRFGRLEEGFSEEPVLTAALVEATTLGSSGGLLKADSYVAADKVPAFWKHCCGYAAAAGGLNGAPAQITEHTLREIYLKPWRRAAAAGARGVMPSHQTLLNVPCHANEWLLNGLLRTEMMWPLAYILSDTGNTLGTELGVSVPASFHRLQHIVLPLLLCLELTLFDVQYSGCCRATRLSRGNRFSGCCC